jgi:hypothetical protein
LVDNSRFRSLQIGVSQESFGGSIQKNMSWAGPNRPLPPEEIPHRLFDRLFGAREQGWINRKRSILDAVGQDAVLLRKGLPKENDDLLAYALATGQTQVASCMLSKCQGLARFPWLGHTAARHHDYTHKDGKAPGEKGPEGQRILRDMPMARGRVRLPGGEAQVDSRGRGHAARQYGSRVRP